MGRWRQHIAEVAVNPPHESGEKLHAGSTGAAFCLFPVFLPVLFVSGPRRRLGCSIPWPGIYRLCQQSVPRMAFVTLSVLEGLERGRIFRNLQTPITIGREEVNTVQLNDERISRLHAKLQEDQGAILFTDLNSTNGSRVNGHPVQIRVLRPGDQLQLGRCTLLFGSADEIRERARTLGIPIVPWHTKTQPAADFSGPDSGLQPAGFVPDVDQGMLPLFCGERPPLPDGLSPLQRARMSDLLMYIHETLQLIIHDARDTDDDRHSVIFAWQRFQNLLHLQEDLAVWLSNASGTGGDEGYWP